jgi:hypothetical protein
MDSPRGATYGLWPGQLATDVADDGITDAGDVAILGYVVSDCAARRLQDVASTVAGAAPPRAGWARPAMNGDPTRAVYVCSTVGFQCLWQVMRILNRRCRLRIGSKLQELKRRHTALRK